MSDAALTPAPTLSDALARTPARLMLGRTGTSLSTAATLALRADHAVARDAVHTEITAESVFGEERVRRYGMMSLATRAPSRAEYLRRPDLGRRLDDASRATLASHDSRDDDIRLVIGDGLSAAAVTANAPALLDSLWDEGTNRNLRLGPPLFVRYCRVGVLNEIGDLLNPTVVVLLVGERPGLATAESLSAYLAYRPRPGHTDANRQLVSNIHRHGLSITEASSRIGLLVAEMRERHSSGVAPQNP
jgi:ethanolamine ammonia-lyase small subunit